MLVVHHLGISQSERVVWLCEELGLDYKLITYTRDPLLAPDALKQVPGNEKGKAPFVEDTSKGVKLLESSAICEYIINTYGNGRLAVKPNADNYADYLHWFHYANGTLQPVFMTGMLFGGAGVAESNAMRQFANDRLNQALEALNDRLKENKWLAGDGFTAADIMTVYTTSTQRYYGPQVNLSAFPNILRWLQDVAARPAYRAAMKKGDPEMKLLLGSEAPDKTMFEMGGVKSDHWKISAL